MAYNTGMVLQYPEQEGLNNSGKRSSSDSILVLLGLLMLTAGVPLVSLHLGGIRFIFNSFSNDCFYYLAAAQRSTPLFYTYDGQQPMSGFHPLWQFLLTVSFRWLDVGEPSSQLYVASILSILLASIGYTIASYSLYRRTRSLLLAFAMVPGAFHIFSSILGCYFFIFPWESMNGMESPLTILFAGIFLALIVKREYSVDTLTPRKTLAIGALLSLIVLSRLDDFFLVIALSLVFLFFPRIGTLQRRFRLVFSLCLPVAIALSCYLLFNYVRTGQFMPLSGVEKANLTFHAAKATVFRFVPWVSTLASNQKDLDFFSFRYTYRIYQVVLPAFISALLLVNLRLKVKKDDQYSNPWIIGTLLYIILKSFYCFFFVYLLEQGGWYFPFAITAVNFLILMAFYKRSFFANHIVSRNLIAGTILIVILLSATTTFNSRMLSATRDKFLFFERRKEIAQGLKSALPENAAVRLLSFENGIDSFSLRFPVLSARYTADYDTHEARKDCRLLGHAYSRGFTILSHLSYNPLTPGMTPEQIANAYKSWAKLRCENISGYTFKIIYVDEVSKAMFVRFTPKQ